MKKTGLILAFVIVVISPGSAQVLKGVFIQKATQKDYLLQQIAALKIYTGYLKKGYAIAEDGLTTIGQFKKGELDLHDGFFKSLKTVNPAVVKGSSAQETQDLAVKIAALTQKICADCKKEELLNPAEQSYSCWVMDRVQEDSKQIADEVKQLTTSGRLQMSDDERIARINRLWGEMQEAYVFCRHFQADVLILLKVRVKELKDLKTSRKINGLK